jgi:hypothetical protein
MTNPEKTQPDKKLAAVCGQEPGSAYVAKHTQAIQQVLDNL